MNNILSEKDTQALFDILVEKLEIPQTELTLDARIQEDLGADSLTVIEITMAVEELFDLSIPDEKWETVLTVRDLFEVLGERLAKPERRLS
jgi:acyl carrier protein